MSKVQIVMDTDDQNREAIRQELASAGIDATGVSDLGYESVADAPVPESMRRKETRGNGASKIRN